ncbi:MAG: hypothetical protein KDB53_14420, partial [Planctomycetes bacterium]|nr:hypothetical protein [Planctomycetota bacterium]
ADLFEDSLHALKGDQPVLSRGQRLQNALRRIAQEGTGAVVVLQTSAPLDAMPLPEWTPRSTVDWQDEGRVNCGDPSAEDVERQIGIGCQILRDLGLEDLRLMTTRRRELPGLPAFGLRVSEYLTDD